MISTLTEGDKAKLIRKAEREIKELLAQIELCEHAIICYRKQIADRQAKIEDWRKA